MNDNLLYFNFTKIEIFLNFLLTTNCLIELFDESEVPTKRFIISFYFILYYFFCYKFKFGHRLIIFSRLFNVISMRYETQPKRNSN